MSAESDCSPIVAKRRAMSYKSMLKKECVQSGLMLSISWVLWITSMAGCLQYGAKRKKLVLKARLNKQKSSHP